MYKILIIALLIMATLGCASTRRQNYIDNNTWMDANERQMILQGKIWVGMTKDQLFASWGGPISWGSSAYSKWYKYSFGRYVYTQGGRVTYWQFH